MYIIIFGTMFKDLHEIKNYIDEEIEFSNYKDCIESEYNNEKHTFIYKCKNKYRKQNVFEFFEELKTKIPGNIELIDE